MIAHKFEGAGEFCEFVSVGSAGRKCGARAEKHGFKLSEVLDEGPSMAVNSADAPMPQTREELEAIIRTVIHECVLVGALDERAL